MRVIYLDPGLRHDLGHHATAARFILDALRTRNIETRVIANAQVTPQLQAELGAVPLFRAYATRPVDPDPIVGWLNTFEAAAQMTLEDLQRIQGIGASDLVYMNSMYADIFLAIAKWTAAFPLSQLPTVVGEFCLEAGLDVTIGDDNKARYRLRDPRIDPRAILFRYGARRVSSSAQHRLHLMTFDAGSSTAYQTLLGLEVGTFPLPFGATTARRRRAGARPITLAVLGHQRPDKGYQHVPEITATLLRQRSDLRVLAHNGDPGLTPRTQDALRSLARADARLTLDERIAGPALWAELLERTDLMLCPYNPQAFAARYSAVACEAVANAIPIVVPARTSLESLLAEFGGPGTAFEKFELPSIVDAVNRALDDFDRYAELAQGASEQWQRTRGPGIFVDQMLALARGTAGAVAAPHHAELGPSAGLR
jgi:hypothetical protein